MANNRHDMKITFDNNCLISLKKKDGEYNEIKTLVGLHPNQITLYIPAIAASENQLGHVLYTNFTHFKEFLAEIGCEKCELLNPMGYYDISYWDHAVFVSEKMRSLEHKIHNILFHEIPFPYKEYCERLKIDPKVMGVDRKWRRAKCDVQAIWCHIHYNNDIFVTSDNNFHKLTKKPRLIELGAKEILTPKECVSRLLSK